MLGRTKLCRRISRLSSLGTFVHGIDFKLQSMVREIAPSVELVMAYIYRDAPGLAWTSGVTIRGLWITPETGNKTGVCFDLWPHTFRIEISSQILLRTWQEQTVWASMESSCHCALLSNFIVSNGITGSEKLGPCLYPCGRIKTGAQSTPGHEKP